VAALPLPTSSAVTDEEGAAFPVTLDLQSARLTLPCAAPDDRLVRIALQRWFTRICEDPVLMVDDELRSFIESDFGVRPYLLVATLSPMSRADLPLHTPSATRARSTTPSRGRARRRRRRRSPLACPSSAKASRTTTSSFRQRRLRSADSMLSTPSRPRRPTSCQRPARAWRRARSTLAPSSSTARRQSSSRLSASPCASSAGHSTSSPASSMHKASTRAC
jgi:hypothetical protein